jgi:PHS family inorganic phosphate transporter-like MFS transporter
VAAQLHSALQACSLHALGLSLHCKTLCSLLAPSQVFVSGVGFLSDAYVLFVINLVKNVLNDLYPDELFPDALSFVGTAALAGAVLGQLVFGGLADRLGRRVIFVCTISFVCLGSIGSSLCFAGGSVNIFSQLIVWQVRLASF